MTRRSDAKTGGAPAATTAPDDAGAILDRLAAVLESRKGGDPERSYVARLLSRGPDAILKKIGEEATETVMAAKDGAPERIVAETADLWFHCLVMLATSGCRRARCSTNWPAARACPDSTRRPRGRPVPGGMPE